MLNYGDLEDIEIVLMEPSEVLDSVRNREVVALSASAAIIRAANQLLFPDKLTGSGFEGAIG